MVHLLKTRGTVKFDICPWGHRCNTHRAKSQSEPDDPMLGFRTLQSQLRMCQRGQSLAQLAQPAPACPGTVILPQMLTHQPQTLSKPSPVTRPQWVHAVFSACDTHPLLSHSAHPSSRPLLNTQTHFSSNWEQMSITFTSLQCDLLVILLLGDFESQMCLSPGGR